MSFVSAFLFLNLFYLGVAQADDDFPIVNISQGALKGQKFISSVGASYYGFQGIPFAKSPVGDLRFKAPEAPEPWNGTLEALQAGNICKQASFYSTEILGDEDCLFLNVFTPQLSGSGDLLPVMVWIYGGGFLYGYSDYSYYNPEFLLSGGVVFVSMNYRLGVFGFLNTEDEAIPGNAGLKDQVMALRWVKQNIAAFGGDPEKVTIFGQSAGSISVSLHLVSPMSQGLFRGAISHSGTVGIPLAIRDSPRRDAFFFGNLLGYSGNSSQELVDLLRGTEADQLIQAQSVIPEEDQYRFLALIYSPSVESVVEGVEAFITDKPMDLITQGKFHNVPYITGLCSSEGLSFIQAILTGVRSTEEVDKDFSKTFKPELRFCKESACGDEMISEIKEFYFGDQPVSNSTLPNLIDLVSDIYFGEGAADTVEKMSSVSSEPVYFYEFSYDGGLGVVKNHDPSLANFPGTTHGDDLGYIFHFGGEEPKNSTDIEVRSEMLHMWVNFAKTLNPTPEATSDIPIWSPYSASSTNYLDIGWKLSVNKDFRKERMDFWKNLYQGKL